MTDIDDLIAEATAYLRKRQWTTPVFTMAQRLLDALKAEHERAKALEDALSLNTQLTSDLNKAESERDAALAVIEKAESYCLNADDANWQTVVAILDDAPIDVLRERDAEKWDEGNAARRMYARYRLAGRNVTRPSNPYRQKREEQDRG